VSNAPERNSYELALVQLSLKHARCQDLLKRIDEHIDSVYGSAIWPPDIRRDMREELASE
jgi:hypothetical protein